MKRLVGTGAQEVPAGVRRPSASGSCLSDDGSEDFEVLHEMESLQQELELMNEYLM